MKVQVVVSIVADAKVSEILKDLERRLEENAVFEYKNRHGVTEEDTSTWEIVDIKND